MSSERLVRSLSFARRLWSNTRFLWGVILLIVVIDGFHCLIRVSRPGDPLGASTTFHNAAINLTRGNDLYAGRNNQYVYPPLIAFLWQPLARLSLAQAGAVVFAINILLLIATFRLLSAEMARRLVNEKSGVLAARIALIAALLTTDKIRGELNLWETNVLVLFMYVAAIALADARPFLAGAALGFAFNIKYLPITLVPYLLLRRRWKMVGGLAASIVFFSVLPAVSMGWLRCFEALAEAYGGLAGLFKIPVHHAAHLFPMTDRRTLSATSGIARMTGWSEHTSIAAGGVLGMAFLICAAIAGRRQGLSPLNWPAGDVQSQGRYHALFAIECTVILMLTLVFSPFTNGAHLYLLLLANAVVAGMLLGPGSHSCRWPLIAGASIMFLGINFPPTGKHFDSAVEFTRWMGLPAWSVLINAGFLYWGALQTYGRTPSTILPNAESPDSKLISPSHAQETVRCNAR